MTMATSTRRGINAAAVTRAADAMLRCLGGAEITLVLPAMAMPTDASSQLGLVDPGVEQVALAPVVVRNLPTAITGPRRRMEFLAPVAAVANEVETRNLASANALFDGALGVMFDGELLHIEGFTTEYFAGAAYLYRIVAVD
jgi:hypothetical protein